MVEKSGIGVHELMSELQVAPWFGGDLVSFLPRDVSPAAWLGQTIIPSLKKYNTATTKAFERKVYLRYVGFQNLRSRVHIKPNMASQSSTNCTSTLRYVVEIHQDRAGEDQPNQSDQTRRHSPSSCRLQSSDYQIA